MQIHIKGLQEMGVDLTKEVEGMEAPAEASAEKKEKNCEMAVQI